MNTACQWILRAIPLRFVTHQSDGLTQQVAEDLIDWMRIARLNIFYLWKIENFPMRVQHLFFYDPLEGYFRRQLPIKEHYLRLLAWP